MSTEVSTVFVVLRKCLYHQGLWFLCNGLLNRRRGKHLYRGFESPPLRSIDDSGGQERSKSAKNQEVTSTQADGPTPSNKPAKVPTDDSTNTMNVRCSDKLDNKLSDKPETDPDLTLVVKAWPELPPAIRSAIMAIVRTSEKL